MVALAAEEDNDVKKYIVIAVVCASFGAVATFWLMNRCGPGGSATSRRGEGAPAGWSPGTEERTSSALQRLNPFHRPTRADAVMRDWPAGSSVVHVETEGGEHVEIGILPDGSVVVPDDQEHEVIIYHKPRSAVGLEFRPFAGGSFGMSGPALVTGVDVVRLGPVNLGAGASVDRDENKKIRVTPLGAASYNVAGPLDVGATIGYNNGVDVRASVSLSFR